MLDFNAEWEWISQTEIIPLQLLYATIAFSQIDSIVSATA
jgi:hypothetical protein